MARDLTHILALEHNLVLSQFFPLIYFNSLIGIDLSSIQSLIK